MIIEPNTEMFVKLKFLCNMKIKLIKKSNALLILMISMKAEFKINGRQCLKMKGVTLNLYLTLVIKNWFHEMQCFFKV